MATWGLLLSIDSRSIDSRSIDFQQWQIVEPEGLIFSRFDHCVNLSNSVSFYLIYSEVYNLKLLSDFDWAFGFFINCPIVIRVKISNWSSVTDSDFGDSLKETIFRS